jgi:hypothetical protein
VATIINVILKGSALLNRLLSQQASNRKALTEQERQKRERAAVEQKRRQAIAKAAPPSFTRRVEEPAATPTGAPTVLVISCTFIDLPDWSFPDGDRPFQATAALNARAEPPTGTLITVTAPPFTMEEWQDFDGRAPQSGGVYQRIYRPQLAIHDRGLSFSFGQSYAVLPRALSLDGTDVATMSSPQFVDLRTDAIAQEFPYMVYPYIIGPRGFGLGFDKDDILIHVYTETSAPDSNDRPGCAILFSVGEQVRIVPFVIFEPGPDRDAINYFMQYYLYPDPDKLYTITAVDRSVSGRVSYTITGGNWPAIAITGMRFYMIRSYATWNEVPASEVRWSSDLQGVPAADLPPNPLNDDPFFVLSARITSKSYRDYVYITSSYGHPLFELKAPRYRTGPTGISVPYPSDQDFEDGFMKSFSAYRARFSGFSRRNTATEEGPETFQQIVKNNAAWLSPIPAGYKPTYDLTFSPTVLYDTKTDVITFNFTKNDNPDDRYPVRIPRAQLRPLLDSTRGNWFFGYNPPFSNYENRKPPGRYASLSVSIISP